MLVNISNEADKPYTVVLILILSSNKVMTLNILASNVDIRFIISINNGWTYFSFSLFMDEAIRLENKNLNSSFSTQYLEASRASPIN